MVVQAACHSTPALAGAAGQPRCASTSLRVNLAANFGGWYPASVGTSQAAPRFGASLRAVVIRLTGRRLALLVGATDSRSRPPTSLPDSPDRRPASIRPVVAAGGRVMFSRPYRARLGRAVR